MTVSQISVLLYRKMDNKRLFGVGSLLRIKNLLYRYNGYGDYQSCRQ